MKKEIKKIGTSYGIIFSKSEMKVYELKLGDIIDLEPVIIKRSRKKNEE